MKEAAISLENAEGALAEWVRRARQEHTTFVVLDNSQAVARLIPADVKSCTGAELARAISSVQLTDEETTAWADELRAAREALLPPEDRWQ